MTTSRPPTVSGEPLRPDRPKLRREDLVLLGELATKGEVRPVIDRTFAWTTSSRRIGTSTTGISGATWSSPWRKARAFLLNHWVNLPAFARAQG
jgi:hypothetical protein